MGWALLMVMAAAAEPALQEIQGVVEIADKPSGPWQRVPRAPWVIAPGQSIRTGAASAAALSLPDDSKINLGPNAVFTMEEARKSAVQLFLSAGAMRAWVAKSFGRSFAVKTPTAVCSVRGTEFLVDVDSNRQVRIEVLSGLVGVRTALGEEVELGDGRGLRNLIVIPDRPLELPAGRQGSRPAAAPARGTLTLQEFKKEASQEVALGLGKDAVQAAAAVEARRAEYQEGKTLVDAFGKRVRIEEYIVRPAADQFKFVVLNQRSDRFDYFYYQATFNQALPVVLAPALRYLNGKTGSAPDYYVTSFETGRSNTIDSIQETGTGGHLVNTPLAEDTVLYDPGSNSFQTVAAGAGFWQTLFNNYSYRVNGAEKYGWQPAAGVTDITAYDYTATGFNTRILGGAGLGGVTCATLACEQTNRPSAVTQPGGADKLHDRATISYSNGSYEIYDSYIISDEGEIASPRDFGGVTNGATYKSTLLKFNFQQVIYASEFQGRKIDLVIEPKILINSGVIQ